MSEDDLTTWRCRVRTTLPPRACCSSSGGRWQHGGGACHTRREARAAYMSDAMIFLPYSAMYDMETEQEELSTRGGAGGWEAP